MNNLNLLRLGLALLMFCCQLQGSAAPIKHTPKQICPVVEMLNELEKLNIFETTDSHLVLTDTLRAQPDLVYEYFIAEMGKQSPIDFDYNPHVRRYIDVYTTERREQVSQMLGLAELYFPLFDESLDKYHLPLELKYLAAVESALNPLAVSKTGAAGIWQFKINTARMFDLKVSSYVDERMDPDKSTEAACRYLEYLYRTFNSWHLAIAAYNVGPEPIRKAIVRNHGETNFWKLYDDLPESAQNYVPAFIAAAYVMQHYGDHGIFPARPTIAFAQTDTVHVAFAVNFSTLSSALNIPVELLRYLNPMYRIDYIPKDSQRQVLRLPSDKAVLFTANKESILFNSPKTTHQQSITSGSASGSSKKSKMLIYTVKDGDSINKIAINYYCTLDLIRQWNPGLDTLLNVGQTLTLWVSEDELQKINS